MKMKKAKRIMFSRIFALMLTVIMMVSIFIPLVAFTAEMEAEPPAAAGEQHETQGVEIPSPDTGDTSGEPNIDSGDITDNGSTETDSGANPAGDDESYTAFEAAIGIMPLSGWIDEETEFYTKIRLTVRDSSGKPIPGVVYGIYRLGTGMLVELITTDYMGVAESRDLPVNVDYYLEEYSIPREWQPNKERYPIYLAGICAPSSVSLVVVYDRAYGTIKIIKTNENGDFLFGVGFTVIYRVTGQHIASIYTNNDGEAEITVSHGDYELYEFAPLPGYEGDKFYLTGITFHGEERIVYITNYLIRGNAYLRKLGNDGKSVANAVFSVYSIDGTWIEDITTSSSGYAYTSLLLVGNYYLVEKSVPAPYVADTGTRYHFSVTDKNRSTYFPIENPVAGNPGYLTVRKTDDSGNPLSGVVFAVYRKWDNKKLYDLTTGEDGRASTLETLVPGEYYLVELSGKDGYEMVTGQIPFTVDGSGVSVSLVVVNPKIRAFGKVRVHKTDDEGTPLDGVRFGIYCKYGNLLEELTTVNGTALSGILNAGTYTLKELSGVPGHVKDDEEYPFAITENNAIVPVDVVNPRITGFVKVIKTGADEETFLPGVTFGVYETDTGAEVCQLTTGEDGTAMSGTLFYGGYELRELATVDGYELITTPIPFSVTEQGVVIEIPVSNSLIFGSVKLIKTDGPAAGAEETDGDSEADGDEITTGDGEPQYLPGAVFGLYNSGQQKIAELVTDENGEAVYGSLMKGDYFMKELSAPEGYAVDDTMIPFAITGQEEVVEITVSNHKGFGTLKVIKHGEDNALLSGVDFEVYRASSDEKAGEITTDDNGEAEIILPLGSYYLRETKAAGGYALPDSTFSFTLAGNGRTVGLTIVNKAVIGTVEVYFRHLDDGRELAPMMSLTDKVGTDYVGWMQTNGYEDMPLDGYEYVRTEYPDSLVIIEGTLTVTLWYDDGEPDSSGITIPKTGDMPPYLNYAIALLMWGLAGCCGYDFLQARKREEAVSL